MNVWTYWEGPEPDYIRVCIASMKRICSTLIVVTQENVSNYIPFGVLHQNYLKLSQPALRADCIRAALLAIHGGWWWDADTVGIRSFPDHLASPESAMYMIWDKPPRRILNGYIYLPADSVIGKIWLHSINKALSEDFNNIDWCSLGEGLLTNLLPEFGAKQIERSTFLPIDIDSSVASFFSQEDFHEYLTEHTVCFGLNHSWFWYHKRKEMENWRSGNHLIHKLLKSAI